MRITQDFGASERQRTWIALGLLLALAFGARLAWATWTSPIPPLLSDPEYYNASALSLARGQGYAVLFDGQRGFLPGGEPTAFWPPGYSLYLAIFYYALGEDTAIARLANVVAGTGAVLAIYLVGLRLFGRRSALGGAAVAALLPSLVFWTPVLLSDTLFTLAFATACAAVLYSVDTFGNLRPGLLSLAACLIAIAALVRGQALVLVPMAGLWWMLTGAKPRTALLSLGLLALGISLLLAPWAIRNIRAMDSPVVLSANLGYNLRIGHAPYSTGRYIVPQDLWEADPGITFRERELLFNTLGTRRALDYAAGHASEEAELSVRKVVWLWRADSDVLSWVSGFGRSPLPGAWEPLRILLDTSYFAVLALAGASFLRAKRFATSFSFAGGMIILWTVAHVVFFGEPRYHLPLLAILCPMAGASIAAALPSIPRLLTRGLPCAAAPA